MATTASVDKENTPIVGRSESQMLEDEVTRLEVRSGPLRQRHCPTDRCAHNRVRTTVVLTHHAPAAG